MRRTALTLAGLVLAAGPAQAQEQPTAVGSVRPLYEIVRGYIHRAADQMPEADYAFRPTPEVRSFGQLLGHIANARYMFCAMVKGEASPAGRNFEEVTAKADLIAALNASAAYCDEAYGITDAKSLEPLTIFGRQSTRLGALTFNAVHDWEHYGNIVTYMRLKGMVPPSSQ